MINSIQSNSWSMDSNDMQIQGQKPPRPPSPDEMFQKIDTDGDEKISQEELTVLASEIEEKTGQALDIEQMLSDYDGDQDGSLTRTELDSAMQSQLGQFQGPPPPPPMGGPNPQDMFADLDEDSDGKLNESELMTLLSKIEEESGQQVDISQLLASYDSDQDAGLTFGEFDAMMKNEISKSMPPGNQESAGQASLFFQNTSQSTNLLSITT